MVRIFLTNLRKYKEGYLIGKWIELPVSDEEIDEVLKEIGINEEYKEYFISDFECDIPGIHIMEHSSIEELNYMAEQLYEMDDNDVKICSTIMKNENCSLDKAIQQKDNRVIINLDKSESNIDVNLACSYINQIYGDVNKLDKATLAEYFDFEKFGGDLKMNFNLDDDETIAVSNT